jgi:hypothetical protein
LDSRREAIHEKNGAGFLLMFLRVAVVRTQFIGEEV